MKFKLNSYMTPKKIFKHNINNTRANLQDQIETNIELQNLDSLGVFMYFDDVSQDSSRAFCEFIIKANFTFAQSS